MDYMMEIVARLLELADDPQHDRYSTALRMLAQIDELARRYDEQLTYECGPMGASDALADTERAQRPSASEEVAARGARLELLTAVLYEHPGLAGQIAESVDVWPAFICELADRALEFAGERDAMMRSVIHAASPSSLVSPDDLRSIGIRPGTEPESLRAELIRSPEMVAAVASATHAPVPFATALLNELKHVEEVRAGRRSPIARADEPSMIQALDLAATRIVEEMRAGGTRSSRLSDSHPAEDSA